MNVRVVPVAPIILVGALSVGGLPVKELHVGSSPTLPAKIPDALGSVVSPAGCNPVTLSGFASAILAVSTSNGAIAQRPEHVTVDHEDDGSNPFQFAI